MGERVPQHVQNLVIRDYCAKKKLHYLLSATEYAMDNSFLILNHVVNDIGNLDGIVAYSLFQMPSNAEIRKNIFSKVLQAGKEIHFAVEGLSVFDDDSCERAEDIWRVRTVLPLCLSSDRIL